MILGRRKTISATIKNILFTGPVKIDAKELVDNVIRHFQLKESKPYLMAQASRGYVLSEGSSFVLSTKELPDFSVLKGIEFSAETVTREEDYLTRARFENPRHLKVLQNLFPNAQFLPKDWKTCL